MVGGELASIQGYTVYTHYAKWCVQPSLSGSLKTQHPVTMFTLSGRQCHRIKPPTNRLRIARLKISIDPCNVFCIMHSLYIWPCQSVHHWDEIKSKLLKGNSTPKHITLIDPFCHSNLPRRVK